MQVEVSRSELRWAASERQIGVRPSFMTFPRGRLLDKMGFVQSLPRTTATPLAGALMVFAMRRVRLPLSSTVKIER
jgi:hypothetical protein